MKIRKAVQREAGLLSELAFRSKAYWGYSEDFMEACREDLTITPDLIESSSVYVLEDRGQIQGFYALDLEHDGFLLRDLFVDPSTIGKGCGKALWNHMIRTAHDLNAAEVRIHSDPNAESFYKKMGAKRIGETASTVFPDRILPLMAVSITGETPQGTMQK
ncbi:MULTISPECIES: GNAT family N-acetyltransferase [unclassified Paenibacillus]|uniref:GNAT family N-acetyltransferase n=1 Tax=unclassified Paenibacillus TaxID=185978 RepID=UPI001C124839|nr:MULTISPECIES: GNAT family N-acetyltransferase [unclassified Paenibacillus]MBU5443843.1 GNAT family N-acetyltransferase [Paenibacillus sp. MSJ-34]CAH0121479.1 hypothetical protein PAE9249_04009 [Paenibacillus sp. CECT 9249]